MEKRKIPVMKLRNVQTNVIWTLSDREQISRDLERTFTSQVACERWVDGKKEKGFIKRAVPRFQVVYCDKELQDLIPKEDATISIREKLLGKEKVQSLETIESLYEYCNLKGITFHPNIGFEKLKERVEKHKEEEIKAEKLLKENPKAVSGES